MILKRSISSYVADRLTYLFRVAVIDYILEVLSKQYDWLVLRFEEALLLQAQALYSSHSKKKYYDTVTFVASLIDTGNKLQHQKRQPDTQR